jgi:hypothetical protein
VCRSWRGQTRPGYGIIDVEGDVTLRFRARRIDFDD